MGFPKTAMIFTITSLFYSSGWGWPHFARSCNLGLALWDAPASRR